MITTLKLSAIAPSTTNPRKHFDAAALAELTESIKAHGILQPVLVRPCTYELDGALSFEWRLVRKSPSNNPSQHKTVDSWRPKQKNEAKAQAAFEKVKCITHELVAGERRWKAAYSAMARAHKKKLIDKVGVGQWKVVSTPTSNIAAPRVTLPFDKPSRSLEDQLEDAKAELAKAQKAGHETLAGILEDKVQMLEDKLAKA